MIAQLQTALQPALNNVTVAWDGKAESKSLLGTLGRAVGSLFTKSAHRAAQQAPYIIPPVLTGTRFLLFYISPQAAPKHVTVTAQTTVGPLAVRVEAKPGEVVEGTVLHCMAARMLIRDLENGTSYLHAAGHP